MVDKRIVERTIIKEWEVPHRKEKAKYKYCNDGANQKLCDGFNNRVEQ